ncbi:TRAP transporter substrate-binding protein [Aquincola sp. MAHUQ-54]|uniref:TRAP transporter substrate-binding protein n=1 Tax=Aquincola agrisoli TaxID=3119538 RepID=A0AAW9Q3F7_9BURK
MALFGAVAASAQTELTVSSWTPPAHMLSQTQQAWCGLLEERSEGRLRCRILPRAAAPAPGTFDAVRQGLADVSFTVHGYTPGRFALSALAELPFLGQSAEAVSLAYQAVFERTPAMQAEHEGVKVLAVFVHGPGMVLNTRGPVTRLEELQALKFRIGGGRVQDIGAALGMNVLRRPSAENLALLSAGAVDGTLMPPESVEAYRLDGVVRYATTFPGGLYNTSFVFMMNQGRYDRLPAEDRAVVDALSGEFAARLFGRGWDRIDRRAMAMMQVSGVQFTPADPDFVQAVKDRTAPLEAQWAEAARARGIADPGKLLADYRADIARRER